MQKIAIFFNLSLLVMVGYLISKNGMPDNEDVPFFVLVVATPIFNSLAILIWGRKSEKGLVALYFKRKKLEEAQRISQLEKNL